MSQLFASGGHSIGASASASVLPVNTQGGLPLGLTGLISLESTLAPQFKSINSSALSLLYCLNPYAAKPNSHIHTRQLEKTIALTMWTFVGKVMSLLFNTLSRFVIAFLLRSNDN